MPRLLFVSDPQDPALDVFRDVRERDLVGRRGLFVAEGAGVLRTLLTASRHAPVSVLAAAHKLPGLQDVLAQAPADLPVHVAPRQVMAAVAGFDIHRGVLAIGRRAPDPDLAGLLREAPSPAVAVCAFGLSNHDNLGGVFRNAAAFGAAAVVLDPASCDPLYRKAIRVSMGAALRLPFVRAASAEAAVCALEAAGYEVLALTPGGRARLRDVRPPARCAVLFGAEGPGLPAGVLARARTVAIPMPAGFDSLNVAVTSGIVLHHLREAEPETGGEAGRPR